MKNLTVTLCAYDRVNACGGPYAWVADFAVFLKEQGVTVRLLILCSGGRNVSALAGKCDQSGILAEVFDTGNRPFLEEEAEWILRQWRQHPSAIFIANLVLPAMYAARWIRAAGAQTIGVIHSNPEHDPFYSDMIRAFVGGPSEWCLNAVVPVSEFIAQKVAKVASAGLQMETIPCGTKAPATNVAWTSGPLRLLYCGRLVQKQKRIRELTEAFLKICEAGGITASICGEGEERSWVESRLAGQDRVRYLGNVPSAQIHKVMASHHVIVLLSDFEGLPMALVEGMSCGLVPVCLDEPSGAREIINDGINGLLVTDRNQAFMAAVDRLRSPTSWSLLSHGARRTVEQRYVHSVVFAKWLALIAQLSRAVELSVDQIPSRISLRTIRGEHFVGYPECRPGHLQQWRERIRAQWMRFRLFVRPRARLRAIKLRNNTPKGAV